MTHRIAGAIAGILYRNHMIEEEDSEVYQYGFEIVIDSVLETLLLMVIGFLIGKTMQTILFILTFTVIRRYSGGFHASTKLRCVMTSIFLFLMAVILSSLDFAYRELCYACLGVVANVIIWIYAPVEHYKKPLEPETIVRCRRYSRVLATLYGIAMLILNVFRPEYAGVIGITLLQVAGLIIIQRRLRL